VSRKYRRRLRRSRSAYHGIDSLTESSSPTTTTTAKFDAEKAAEEKTKKKGRAEEIAAKKAEGGWKNILEVRNGKK